MLTSFIRNGAIPMSVNDVVVLTLKNNLDIGVDRMAPLSSRIAIDSFYRPFDPALRITTTVNQNTAPSSSQLSGAPSVSQLGTGIGVGYSQYLQTGTTVGVDFDLSRNSTNSVFSTFNPAWSGSMKYSATQHFLKDYGRVINARQFKVAKNNVELSDNQFERQVIELVTQAEKSYWDLLFTFEDLKVKQGSKALADKTLSDNRIQVDAGALAMADLVQAESEVADRSEQLIRANYIQDQVTDQVKKLVTNGPDPGIVLVRITPTQMVPPPRPDDVMSKEEAIRFALENRLEMRAVDLQMKNTDIDIQYTKNQLLPSLDVTAAYTQSGLGGFETLRNGFGSTAPVIGTFPGGITDALGQVVRNDFRGYSFSATLLIPLSNRAPQAEHARALADRRTEENRKAATASAIALEVRNAVTQVEMGSARIEAVRKIRELAEQKLAFEQRKFDLGAQTIRFVLEEQRNVTQAQTDEVAALISYAKSLVDYNHAIGMTLKKNNIVLDRGN
jgi:outer membrane protein TolC